MNEPTILKVARGRLAAACLATLLALTVVAAPAPPASQPADPPPPRRTWVVDLYERCRPSVVMLETVEYRGSPSRPASRPASRPQSEPSAPKGKKTTHWGSGVIIHRDGYLLTNSHCFRHDGRRRATCHDGQKRDVVLVADDPEHDLALARIVDGGPFTPIRVGRSHDLMVGEPVVTMGNPFGMGLTLSLGIISALNRNTNTDYAKLSGMIMTEAAANPGTSGGPLLNVRGELIGIITSRKTEGDNLGFAVPVDHAWRRLPELLLDGRTGILPDLQLELGPDEAKITGVSKGSAAEKAGFRGGDVLVAIGGKPLAGGIDAAIELSRMKTGQDVAVTVRRAGKKVELAFRPRWLSGRAPETPEPKLQSGLTVQQYAGDWKKLPDLDALKPASTGTAASVGVGEFGRKGGFALRLKGFIHADSDGVHTFRLDSNDGSRLYVGSDLAVENDGTGQRTARGHSHLKAGWHPITIVYFSTGDKPSLKAFWECPNQPRREIPAAALGH